MASILLALEQSIAQIAELQNSGRFSDDSAETFAAFRKAVTKASSGQEAPPEQLLGGLPSKVPVLRFLLALHAAKRTYRRQIAAVLSILLHERSWHQALLDDETLFASLPDDLRTVAEEVMQSEEPRKSLPSESVEPRPRLSSRGERTLKLLGEANAAMSKIRFSAADPDSAIDAFQLLHRAVMWAIQSPEKDEGRVLEEMEAKESVLEFLADFYSRKPKHRARVSSLCIRLLGFDADLFHNDTLCV